MHLLRKAVLNFALNHRCVDFGQLLKADVVVAEQVQEDHADGIDVHFVAVGGSLLPCLDLLWRCKPESPDPRSQARTTAAQPLDKSGPSRRTVTVLSLRAVTVH